MLDRVWSALDDDSADHQRYPSATVLTYLNEGAQFYLVRTRSVHTSTTVTQTPGTALYALPSDCVAVTRVSWVSGGANYPVSPTTMRELDERMGRNIVWERDTGTRAEWYYIFGVDQIGLYPEISSSTATYTVHYISASYAVTPGLGTDAAIDHVPEEDHEGLVAYATARCLAADKNAKAASEEFAAFDGVVTAAKSRRTSPDRQFAMAGTPGWQGISGGSL